MTRYKEDGEQEGGIIMRKLMIVVASVLAQPAVYADTDVHAKAAKDLQKHAAAHSHEKIKPSARFSFEETGGFAPMQKSFETRIHDLPKAERHKLLSLIEDSGLLSAKMDNNTNKNAADVHFFHFVLINGKTTHDTVFDSTTLPDSYKSLLEFVKPKLVDSNRT